MDRLKIFLSAILLSCLMISPCDQLFSQEDSTQAWESKYADYDFADLPLRLKVLGNLRRVLLGYTGRPYLYTDSITIANAFDSTEKALEERVSLLEQYRAYCRLIAMVRDGHTGLKPPDRVFIRFLNERHQPPLDVDLIQERLFVVYSYRFASDIEIGSEILTINSDSIKTILNKMYKFMPSDGYNKTFKQRMIRNFFWMMYYLYANDTEYFVMHIRDPNGAVEKVELRGVDLRKSIFKENWQEEKANLYPRKIGYPTLEIDSAGNYAIFKIGTFHNPNQSKYEKIILDHISSVNQSGVENLIVDLRNNTGGRFEPYVLGVFLDEKVKVLKFDLKNAREGTPADGFNRNEGYFIMYKKRIKERNEMMSRGINIEQYEFSESVLFDESFRFKGNLVVLVNGYTFSAASILASQLKYHAKATIVGEETGGSYLHGNTGQLTNRLGNNFFLTVNPLYFQSVVPEYQDYKGGLLPDIEVIESFDPEKLHDPYVEAALEYFDSLK